MKCPFCQHPENRVLESRSAEAGQSIRRRRECLQCKHRFTTYERIEFVSIIVLKRDGKRESFDRSKLLCGIVRACEKTGIPQLRLEAIVDEVESLIQQRASREVTSNEIGEMVLQKLQSISEVAYVRFASIYRQFRGIRDFVDSLNQLKNHRDQPDNQESAADFCPNLEQSAELSRISSERFNVAPLSFREDFIKGEG